MGVKGKEGSEKEALYGGGMRRIEPGWGARVGQWRGGWSMWVWVSLGG